MTRTEFLARLVVIATFATEGKEKPFYYEIVRLMDDLNLK